LFFPLALPFKVCKSDVFVVVLPVHTIPTLIHFTDKVLSALGLLSAVHDRKGYILHIAFDFPSFGLLQEVVCVLAPCNCFFSLLSGECLAFLRNMKPLLPALLITPLFDVCKVFLAPLEFVSVLEVHTINDKMSVYVSSVYVRGNEYLMPFPCFCTLGKLHRIFMGLLGCYLLVLMVGLYKVLVGSATCLSPHFLCCLHFFFDCFRFTMQTADKLLLGLFVLGYIVQCLPYACF